MRLAVVEVGQIFEVIWVSLLAGVGITIAYSLVVFGTGRSAEARRAGRGAASIVYGGLALVCLAVFAGGIVLGVQIMLTKD
jgi:hypothetical protein